jgi:hypothetical protein
LEAEGVIVNVSGCERYRSGELCVALLAACRLYGDEKLEECLDSRGQLARSCGRSALVAVLLCCKVVEHRSYCRVAEEPVAVGCKEVLEGLALDGAVVLGLPGRCGGRPCDYWGMGEYCLAECVGDTCDEAFWDVGRPCDLAAGEEDEAVGRGGGGGGGGGG